MLEADYTEAEKSHKERKEGRQRRKTAEWYGFSLECFGRTVFPSLEQTCLGNSTSALQHVHIGL